MFGLCEKSLKGDIGGNLSKYINKEYFATPTLFLLPLLYERKQNKSSVKKKTKNKLIIKLMKCERSTQKILYTYITRYVYI